jgi:gamma-butyrobetaine dioxygenase/trimethyllysine dioxygenase
LDVKPTNISVDGETLSIKWERSTTENENPHKSEYEASWLRQWAYALNRVEVQPIPNDVSLLEIDFKGLQEKYPSEGGDLPLSSEGYRIYLSQIYDRITKHGAVVIRNRGLDTEAIISDLLPKDKEVIPTHFGRIEDLRTDNTTNENTDQLGYTNAGVDLHTDQPFIANPVSDLIILLTKHSLVCNSYSRFVLLMKVEKTLWLTLAMQHTT